MSMKIIERYLFVLLYMKVEISVGEGIDKLSVLEIKYKKIDNEKKREEIQKEIQALYECVVYKTKYKLYYRILEYINEKIWDLTDYIRTLSITDSQFTTVSSCIFKLNENRYRLKNIFNQITASHIQEQKNQKLKKCRVVVKEESTLYNKLEEINSLIMDYDFICFDSPFLSTIRGMFNAPVFHYEEEQEEQKTDINGYNVISLNEYTLDEEIRPVFRPPPLYYVAGGQFGDFIHQLSVVNEYYYKYGRKGVLYITDDMSQGGDSFRFGLQNTYRDTFDMILSQPYIVDYKMYNNEPYDVNLNDWRKNPKLHVQGWHITFQETYDIEWGKHKWIIAPMDQTYRNKVVINTTHYRFCDNIDFKKLYAEYGDEIVFVSADENQYRHFLGKTGISIPFVKVENFSQLCVILSSCKLFVGSRSAPLAIAHATKVNQIFGTSVEESNPLTVVELQNIWEHIKFGFR